LAELNKMKKEKRLRLSVFRSNKYIYSQIIDDEKGISLVAYSSKNLKSQEKKSRIEQAKEVGKRLAEKALSLKIKKVFFDRGRFRYHGQVKALADGAREGGLEF